MKRCTRGSENSYRFLEESGKRQDGMLRGAVTWRRSRTRRLLSAPLGILCVWERTVGKPNGSCDGLLVDYKEADISQNALQSPVSPQKDGSGGVQSKDYGKEFLSTSVRNRFSCLVFRSTGTLQMKNVFISFFLHLFSKQKLVCNNFNEANLTISVVISV